MKEVAILGLGKMGGNIALHLAEQGIKVIAHNRTHSKAVQFVEDAEKLRGEAATPEGAAVAVESFEELANAFTGPRTIIMYLPSLAPTEEAFQELLPLLSEGDVIIDGGNNQYKEAVKHSKIAADKGIGYLDCGTSGGMSGARNGACLMIGGSEEVFDKSKWLFEAIAMTDGYAYMGSSGSGHYVKMTHNGIEYAILQAYADGFQILHEGPYTEELDFHKISKVWNHGSVIRSWMLELAEEKFAKEPRLESIVGTIGGGETGRWTVEQAHEQGTPAPSIELAVNYRKTTEDNPTFAGRVIAAIRNGFGGHVFKTK
ncbi:MAG: NADP-dependent phosphogluconate dehydrogenase [Candidatus Peregrinibacteria bacterium]|nr:NADP-dependent phosphogluconate dehydrogenase [Candidatus Peregrinibacteria bacterium]MDZ4244953.1 NADP-dependent phosphogluconate dehydrogenase [Candidatus Gracilibacteria bacterium]